MATLIRLFQAESISQLICWQRTPSYACVLVLNSHSKAEPPCLFPFFHSLHPWYLPIPFAIQTWTEMHECVNLVCCTFHTQSLLFLAAVLVAAPRLSLWLHNERGLSLVAMSSTFSLQWLLSSQALGCVAWVLWKIGRAALWDIPGSNPYPLGWEVDSLPLVQQRSPVVYIFKILLN